MFAVIYMHHSINGVGAGKSGRKLDCVVRHVLKKINIYNWTKREKSYHSLK